MNYIIGYINCKKALKFKKLQKIIDTFNKNQPTYKRISALDIRKEPFEKSSTKKIKRNLV